MNPECLGGAADLADSLLAARLRGEGDGLCQHLGSVSNRGEQ
jgi:hypothetical protein